VKQSFTILVPTNFTGPWYHDRGLQVVKEIRSLLVREQRFVGLLIAGIVAAITAIATMATAAVALSQSIQNAYYINTLTQNVSSAFQQQVVKNEKIDIHLNSLEVVCWL
jgi:predicted membrane-bound spermidine synthase